jgi:tRNA-dihydrouridine synthase
MIKIGKITLPDFPLLLAPMEDVSDPPFRAVCKQAGADLMFSEFISSEGLIRDAIKSRQKLDIFEEERPVGIQIFGGDEEAMALSARIVETVQPDLLDINFGCPVKKVVTKGAGAAVLKDLDLMVRLTSAVIKSTNLPVTVKTRLGWDHDSINIMDVAERLQDVGVQALSIHGRTRCQLYKGEADWTYIAEVKNNQRIKIPIFGNGDVDSPARAVEYRNKYGIEHFMATGEILPPPTIAERIEVIKKHLYGSVSWKGPIAGINEMKRHYANYLHGLPGIKEYRNRLVMLKAVAEIVEVLEEVKEKYEGYAALSGPDLSQLAYCGEQ